MLLNAKQYRFNRGFKLYTSTRLNDKTSLSLTDEIKSITALNNGDKNLKEEEPSNDNKYNGSDLNGAVIGEVALVNDDGDGEDRDEEVVQGGEVKDDEIEKDDHAYNDDSDFKKWLQNSELGRNKSRSEVGKKENKNDLEKVMELPNGDCKHEVERFDVHNGDSIIENGGNHVKNFEMSEKDVTLNGTCEQTEVKKTESNCRLPLESEESKTAKSVKETDEMLKANFYLNDYIPENEFKIVNYKKKPKTVAKPEPTDNTQVKRRYESRDQRSFRRFNKTNNLRSKTFKKASKTVSCVLENKNVIEGKNLEAHVITSDLEGSKRTDSECQSSSSSSVTSDLPSSPSTLSSSPSPQPPHSNPSSPSSPLPHNDTFSNNAQDNLSLTTTKDSTPINDQTSLTDTSKVTTTESHSNCPNEQAVSSEDTTSSNSTSSSSCLSYSKIVSSLNEEKLRKEACQAVPSSNKNQSKNIKPLENEWHRRVVKTKTQFIKNKTSTLSSPGPSQRNTTSLKPDLTVSQDSSTTKDLVIPSKCPEKSSSLPPCDQDTSETRHESDKGVRKTENQTQKAGKRLKKNAKFDNLRESRGSKKMIIKDERLINKIMREESFDLKATQNYLMQAFEENSNS